MSKDSQIDAQTEAKMPKIPLIEIIKSIPEMIGLRVNEEPDYEVQQKDGPFEVRNYQPQVRASVTLQGLGFDEFRETAFKMLASYIFGQNHLGAEVPMTAPVLQEGALHDESVISMTAPVLEERRGEQEWTMSFVLPKTYTLETAPRPNNHEIKLELAPAQTVAVLRYSGSNSLKMIETHAQELTRWMNSNESIHPLSEIFSAQYDAPFTIPFLKRNEVQARVKVLNSETRA